MNGEPMGWLEDFVAWGRTRSPEASPSFLETVGLYTLSAAVGNNMFCPLSSGPVFANVWTLLVGESGLSHKSTCLKCGTLLLDEVVKDRRLSDSHSPEGLMEDLATKERANTCVAYFAHDEFGQLIAGMKHKEYMSDIKDILMKLYDGAPLSRRTRSTVVTLPSSYVAFSSATTEERLSQVLTPGDVMDGFLARFLISTGRNNGFADITHETTAQAATFTKLAKDLSDVVVAYDTNITQMFFDDDALDNYNLWMRDLRDEVVSGHLSGAVSSRLEAYFVKLCMLWELSDRMAYLGGRHQIPFERTEQVRLKMETYKSNAVMLHEKLGSNRDVEHVYRIIERAGPDGINRRRILRLSGFQARKLEHILFTLAESGRVDVEERGGKGPVATYYKAVK